jgi:hypothetical protein
MIEVDVENILNFDKPYLTIVDEGEDSDLTDEDSPFEDDEGDQQSSDDLKKTTAKKRKRSNVGWRFSRTLESSLYVDVEIKPKYSNYKTHDTLAGLKVFYRCKYRKCPAKLHLLYLKYQTRISMFTNQGNVLS